MTAMNTKARLLRAKSSHERCNTEVYSRKKRRSIEDVKRGRSSLMSTLTNVMDKNEFFDTTEKFFGKKEVTLSSMN